MTTLYKTGAISIGAGSTNVNGSGTAWTTSGTRPGDLLIAGGAVAEIASVSSATGITLANGWPGATQAAVNYAILQLDDGLRALIAANTLLQALDGGTLTSLAGLDGVANTLPYFTGEKVMGLTDFGAAARTFLAADPVMTSNALDATVGRLMKVGDFGLGNTGTPETVADLDDATIPSGMYRFTSATANKPSGVSNGVVLVNRYNSAALSQTLWRDDGATVLTRYRGASWSTWRALTPERGSNGNGQYVRLPDGTQLCWHALDDTGTAWATAQGPLYSRASALNWIFPASFASDPLVLCAAHIGNEWVMGCRPRSVPGTGAVSLLPWTTGPSSAGTVKTVFSMAIGRWF